MAKEENATAPAKHSRSKLLYIGSIIILVLVIVTFVGAPAVTGSIGGSANLVFGRYDGQDISYRPGNFFARQYDAIAQTLRGAADEFQLEFQLRLAWREAFNRAIVHAAVLQRARAAGLVVSERRIDELIASDPRFVDNGRFSAEAYRRLGNQERFALRNYYREAAVFEQFIADSMAQPHSSEAESAFFAAVGSPERAFRVVRFPFSTFPSDLVRQFAAENADLFTQLNLAVITLPNQQEADQIRARANNEPFADLARTFSRDSYSDQGGEIGSVPAHQIQRELVNLSDLDQIVRLRRGETSTPVQTTGGFAFYRAQEDPQPIELQDEQAVARVREYMTLFETGRVQDYVNTVAADFAALASQAGLVGAAETRGLEVLQTDYFGVNFGNLPYFSPVQTASIPDLADGAYRDDFFRALFGVEIDQVSAPIVLRESVIVAQPFAEREVSAEDRGFLVSYYDAITQQFNSDYFETAFVDRSRLQDNFATAFSRYVLGN